MKEISTAAPHSRKACIAGGAAAAAWMGDIGRRRHRPHAHPESDIGEEEEAEGAEEGVISPPRRRVEKSHASTSISHGTVAVPTVLGMVSHRSRTGAEDRGLLRSSARRR